MVVCSDLSSIVLCFMHPFLHGSVNWLVTDLCAVTQAVVPSHGGLIILEVSDVYR